jgi:hypothetical protein
MRRNIAGAPPFFTGRSQTLESIMSDSRHTDPLRRLNLQATARTAIARTASVRTSAAPTMWTTLWTWLAAIVAAVVVLGLVFGYSRNDLARHQSGEPVTTGSAAAPVPASAPLSAPRLGDTRARAPAHE